MASLLSGVIVAVMLAQASRPGPSPAAAAAASQPAGAASLTVLTYNVNRDAWDKETVRPVLLAAGADLVCLQECDPAWFEAIYQGEVRTRFPFVLTNFNGLKSPHGALVALSRTPLERPQDLPPPAMGWFPAQAFQVQTALGRIQVVNVHLRPMVNAAGLLGSGPIRLAEVRAHAAALPADPPLPTLWVGDFNEGEEGLAVAWLKQRGLVDALDRTDPAAATWRQVRRGIPMRGRPDHLLAPPTLRCVAVRIIDQGPSDHLPVVAVYTNAAAAGGPARPGTGTPATMSAP